MAGCKWNEVLDTLTESYKHHLWKIDRRDFVSFCAGNKDIRNTVCKYLQNFKKTNSKSSTKSLANYNQGQKLYNENKYECLSLFNSSIAYATNHDAILPDLYNSRSLVLYQLGHASESLRDLEIAVRNGHVEDSEVVLRKARCLVKLGIVNEAKDVLSCPKLKNEIQENFKETDVINNLPKLTGGENENFVSASNYINVNHSLEKGRHVIANHDIRLGDVLFVEKPYAFVLFKDVCHNCCKNTVAPIFCWECVEVGYCSHQCQTDFQKTFHQFECGFSDLFKSIGIAHLSLRIILKASSSLEELKKILSDIEEAKYEDEILSCKIRDYEAVCNLVNNADKFKKIDLFQYSVTALLIALYLKNNTFYINKASTEDDLKFLTGVLLRHILQLVCNGHAIVDTFLNVNQKNSVYTETEERIGTAIYPSASMMNHSCQPTIINSFYNGILVVKAAKEIRKGEEVYNCYGPDARRMRRSERQEILKKQYFFTCQCHACLQKHDIQEIFRAFKCSECKEAFIPVEEHSHVCMCIECGKSSEISNELKQKEILFYLLFREGEKIEEEDIIKRLRIFLKTWRLGREIFYTFHKDLSFAADEIARCLAIMEDFRRCALFLRCCVRSVEKRFGSVSIELAKEMKKLGDAFMRYSLESGQKMPREMAQEGLLYYEKAEQIISLLYNSNHLEVKEIKENKRILQG